MFEITDRVNGMTEQTRKGAIGVLVYEIKDEIDQLERWATEARQGGYSTQQEQPMKDRAEKLRNRLRTMGFPV